MPLKREPPFSIAIPASFVSDIPHLREKTLHVGLVARAAAIFRVNEILVYRDRLDRDQTRERKLISTILSYMETPQYLKKRMFPKNPILKNVGILPPLRTSHHPLKKQINHLKDGELREGLIISSSKSTGSSLVDIGVERPISLNETVPIGKRITVRISKKSNKIRLEMIEKSDIEVYWGYHVCDPNLGLGQIINRGIFDLIIMTSKYGRPTDNVEVIKESLKRAHNVLIAFGSPKEGLRKILKREGFKMGKINNLIINTIPLQGTKTVRMEEALYATLAIINVIV